MPSIRKKQRPPLGIVELAVDPADVDEDRYPVRIRLTRPLTTSEVEGLATAEPGLRAEADAIVVPDARLDDVARDHASWLSRLERVESVADEIEGETLVANDRRLHEKTVQGSHLRSQNADNRGLH